MQNKLPFVHLGWLVICFHIAPTVTGQEPDAALYLESLILTTDVVNREPVDTVQAFAVSIDSLAFCHLRVHNMGPPDTLVIRWQHNNQPYASRRIRVGTSTSWRTFSAMECQAGRWKVEISTGNGEVLGSKEFSILESTVSDDSGREAGP
ncbi:MAG TPA: DUF2914 domain-containing protein [bacterium]|nr:DUF2914 domain-containing protein [bacterium]